MCLTWATFAEGCTVFQLSTSESLLISNGDTWMGKQSCHLARGGILISRRIIYSTITRQVVPGATIGYADRIADMHWYTNPMHIL